MMPTWDFGEDSPTVYRFDDVLVDWHNTYALLKFTIELSCVVAYGPVGREACELIRRVIESFSSTPTYNLFPCLPPIAIHVSGVQVVIPRLVDYVGRWGPDLVVIVQEGWNADFSDHSLLVIEIEGHEFNLDDFPTLFESTPAVVEVRSLVVDFSVGTW
ncbi:hypothetical protein Dimus_001527, partial [Dionaea muscipula]